jgi:hypothetical protein
MEETTTINTAPIVPAFFLSMLSYRLPSNSNEAKQANEPSVQSIGLVDDQDVWGSTHRLAYKVKPGSHLADTLGLLAGDGIEFADAVHPVRC